MPRVHKNYREGRCSRFTNESKFLGTNTRKMAEEAIREGDRIRKMISGRRILLDLRERELKNAFRL